MGRAEGVARAVAGVLKGYDPVTNVVLDDCKEFIRGKKGK